MGANLFALCGCVANGKLHLSDLAHLVWSSPPEPRPLSRRNPTWLRPLRLRSRQRRIHVRIQET
ncbi:hypothetical protein E2562_018384 [Oryza meyeriana var. granulata]|uniref:Uncharacterized protein n=1 Tax=Oryza meyeriana var. granulata TaxID=110450 RepID=A0A6G1D5C1_9ORYZ|nr:hypothetical protein E2562_018384 [Oryza meyeriana var. granulata]